MGHPFPAPDHLLASAPQVPGLGVSSTEGPRRPPAPTGHPSPSPEAKRRKWGKRWVPFSGPRAWGWPACCRQERGNLERFPLRMCQIIQWRGGATRACACLTRMCCPSSSLRDQALPRPAGSLQELGGPRIHEQNAGKPASWHSGQASGDRIAHTKAPPHARHPLADRQTPMHPSIPSCSFPTQPSQAAPHLAPVGPVRAPVTQPHVYQTERSASYGWRSAGCWDTGMTQINISHFQGNSQPGFCVSFEIISAHIRILFETGSPPGAGRECDLGSGTDRTSARVSWTAGWRHEHRPLQPSMCSGPRR